MGDMFNRHDYQHDQKDLSYDTDTYMPHQAAAEESSSDSDGTFSLPQDFESRSEDSDTDSPSITEPAPVQYDVAADVAARAAFHFPVDVPLVEDGLADLQLSYVAGSLAVAESELVAQGVDAVLSQLVPQYVAFLAANVAPDQRLMGAAMLARLLKLMESLVNSMRNLAVADPLTHWNEAVLSVLQAQDLLHGQMTAQ